MPTATGITARPSPDTPGGRLQLRRFDNAATALGTAVSYLMTTPAFARRAFGHWTRVLVGQINRGHYVFVYDADEVVGFAAWVLANADAEAWLDGEPDSAGAGRTGDCIVVNAGAASTPAAHRLLLDHLHQVAAGKRAVCARRICRDRRARPIRLRINPFVHEQPTTAAWTDTPSPASAAGLL